MTIFADLYRQEVAAEEDVYRTLPFFGTGLGIMIGALAYVAGHLPKWPGFGNRPVAAAFIASAVLLGLAIAEAAFVLLFLSRAIALRGYRRIGPETALRARMMELQDSYDAQAIASDEHDKELVKDIRQTLLALTQPSLQRTAM